MSSGSLRSGFRSDVDRASDGPRTTPPAASAETEDARALASAPRVAPWEGGVSGGLLPPKKPLSMARAGGEPTSLSEGTCRSTPPSSHDPRTGLEGADGYLAWFAEKQHAAGALCSGAGPFLPVVSAAMWNQGKSAFNMNVDTDDARRRAERVMETAARSGAALPLHSTWVRKIDESDPKSRWIVEGSKPDATANDPLAAHLDLEAAVGRPPSAMGLADGDSDSSSNYDDSSDSESRGKKSSRKRKERDGSSDSDRKGSKKRKKEGKRKKRKKEKKSRRDGKRSKKSKKSRRSSSSSSSSDGDTSGDSDGGDRKRISAVSGKKIKLKLEGTSARTDAEDKRRQAYLRSLNAHVDMSHLTGR